MSYQELSIKTVTGKKDYVCIWCGEQIDKGERHETRAYKFYGDFHFERTHSECAKAMVKRDWGEDDSFEPHSYKRGTIEQSEGR